MKKIISTLFLTLLLLCISLMNSYASNIIIEKSGENNVKIESVNGVFYLKTDIQLTGYSVNCSGDKLILWGHSKILNESNPQDSLIILFDLTKQIKIKEQGFSKGVFDVNFIKKNNTAYIDSDPGFIINVITGNTFIIPQGFDPSEDDNFEHCEKDKSWTYDKYRNNQ